MRSALVLLGCTAIAYAATAPTDKKTEADGHRHHRSRWGGYGGAPLMDRNVCDLDASVLVVVEGGRRGYNKARRVKCADVAAADEDSCMVCCQNAARRDNTIRNEDIFGFLTVIDHFEKDSRESWEDSHDDDYARKNREKRGTDDKKEDSLENFEPIKNFRNLKCLCCAPRRQLPPPPIYAMPVPTWGAYQSYGQQPAQQYPVPAAAAPAVGYAVPAAAPAGYAAPAA
ncbi:hypothetical protein PFISCL1PPCAC_24704, partial [Pristionchus fissidentatus]